MRMLINLKQAAWRRETLTIAGGEFDHHDVAWDVATIEMALYALKEAEMRLEDYLLSKPDNLDLKLAIGAVHEAIERIEE